ncbi:MAG: aminotransferase class III-fold pyridoxal phosphate-dependent enzyme, partial [Ruminococcus sp.]
MTTQEKQNQSVMGTYGRFPVVLEQGAGDVCTDENGKSYIDFGSGIGTSSLGYCNDAWAEAVCTQARKLQHTSNLYYTKVQADYAEALCRVTGYANLFFCNSGAESNECAIKLARKYSFDKYGKGRHN